MPPGFRFPGEADVARPLALTSEETNGPGDHYLEVVARLKDGVSLEQAQAEMSALAVRVEQEFVTAAGHGVVLIPLHEQVVSLKLTRLTVRCLAAIWVARNPPAAVRKRARHTT